MAVVCLINMKGGVGKTTLTLALSDFLSSLHRKRVLLIDLDPQANLTTAAIGENRWAQVDQKRRTVADAFDAIVRGEAPAVHTEIVGRVTGAVPVALIAGTPRLADIEAEAMETDQTWRIKVGSPYMVLHRALFKDLDLYDHVLIDCPPSLGVVTLNGLMLADGYLIPVMPSPVAVAGIKQLAAKIEGFSKNMRRPLKRYGTVVNRIDARTNLHLTIIRELEKQPEVTPIWNSRIRHSVRAEEGWDDSSSKTLIQRWGALYPDLMTFTEEFTRRVK